MKAIRYLGLFSAAAALFLATACTQTPATPLVAVNGVPPLQVQVVVPPSWRPMFDENVSDALASHIIDVFQREGFRGNLSEVALHEEPTGAADLLTVRLMEWRGDALGNINCTFAATIQTPQGSRDLGIFNGTGFRWMSGLGRFGLAETFGDAADDATRDLYRALASSHLVPGAMTRARR
jgi:hypothetical protein